MKKSGRAALAALAVGLCLAAVPAFAQQQPEAAGPAASGEEEGEEAEKPAEAAPAAKGSGIDPAKIAVPDLAFDETPGDVKNYDKYFYFVRADTDFETAYADILECDGYARGLSHRASMSYVNPYPFVGVFPTMFATALGSALSDAIYGSAERRRQRRENMRTCMYFKEYKRFGLPKSLWSEFNFEEGNSPPPERERRTKLQQQAKVASGPMPVTGELER